MVANVGNLSTFRAMIWAGGAHMAHGGPRRGDGPPEGHCALSAMGRIGPEIGSRARRLGLMSDQRRWMRNTSVVIMDIFPIFYIIIFAIWKIPGNYQIRARGKSSRRRNRGNSPKSLASRNQPHLEFRWVPSQVMGGLGAETGVLWGKIGLFISFWG